MRPLRGRQNLSADSYRPEGMAAILWDHWHALQTTAGGAVPAKAALSMRALKEALPDLIICEVEQDGVVRIRLSGTRVDDMMGVPLTGRPVLDLTPPAQRTSIDFVYRSIRQQPCGFYIFEDLARRGGKMMALKALLLPLTDRGGEVRFYVSAYQFGEGHYDPMIEDPPIIEHHTIVEAGFIDIGFGLPDESQ